MTNKLRSVIEDQETFVRTVSYQITVGEDNAVPLRLARKALHRLTTGILDAIIEEMEKDELNRGKAFINIDKEKQPTIRSFHLGGIQAVRATIDKLKQARAELSTSLTE